MPKDYKRDNLTVHWDAEKCIHSGICARGLQAVFDPRRRPWIDLEKGELDEIKDQVMKSPSGALRFTEG